MAPRPSRVALLVTLALLVLLTVAGCRFPDDVEGTLDRAEGGVLRVGWIDSAPWATQRKGEIRGVEAELIREFAAGIGARIEWHAGTEAELSAALEGYQLDVVIGGLTRSSPYRRHVALTRPYIDTEIEVGVGPGEQLPDDLDGVRVWVERGSEAAALLRTEEDAAEPVPYDSAAGIRAPAVLPSYELRALGLQSRDYILRDHEHAMALPMGENAFMVALEKFLLTNEWHAEQLLGEESERWAEELAR